MTGPRARRPAAGWNSLEVTAAEAASARAVAAHWTRRRDDLICAARARGETLRSIAARAGLSHGAVSKIVAREGR